MWMEKSMDTQCLCKLIWTIDNLRMRHCSLWISPPFLKIVNCVFVSVWTQILICILQRRVVFGRIYRDLCRQQVEASPFPVSCSQTQTHRSSSLCITEWYGDHDSNDNCDNHSKVWCWFSDFCLLHRRGKSSRYEVLSKKAAQTSFKF